MDGLGINHTIIILAILLIIIDFFLISDALTHISYVLFCIVIYRLLELSLLYKVLISLCFWFLIVTLHYFIFKKYLSWFANKYIAPDKYSAGIDGLVGKKGVCKKIEEHLMIEIKGDLWAFESSNSIKDGDAVLVENCKNGLIEVSLIKEN